MLTSYKATAHRLKRDGNERIPTHLLFPDVGSENLPENEIHLFLTFKVRGIPHGRTAVFHTTAEPADWVASPADHCMILLPPFTNLSRCVARFLQRLFVRARFFQKRVWNGFSRSRFLRVRLLICVQWSCWCLSQEMPSLFPSSKEYGLGIQGSFCLLSDSLPHMALAALLYRSNTSCEMAIGKSEMIGLREKFRKCRLHQVAPQL